MHVTGIISEYNPLHGGHISQLRRARENGADFIIVAMSGDFVQRGEPAVFDKACRTRAALLSGADLVLEIPAAFSTSAAPDFAAAGVALLDRLGVVDDLCFGSECGDISLLRKAAQILIDEPYIFKETLRTSLGSGSSYPKAQAEALRISLQDDEDFPSAENGEDIFSSPNNILGIEYIKALMLRESRIRPFTYKREGQAYNDDSPAYISSSPISSSDGADLEKNFPSASAIRKAIKDGGFDYSEYLKGITGCEAKGTAVPVFADDLSTLLNDKLLEIFTYLPKDEALENIGGFYGFTPELASRLYQRSLDFDTFTGRAWQLKSKTFTYARVSRALLHLVLGVRETDVKRFKEKDYIPYIRVLGFRRSAGSLPGLISRNSSLPIITKTAGASESLDADGRSCLCGDLYASHLYQSIVYEKGGAVPQNEYTRPLIVI